MIMGSCSWYMDIRVGGMCSIHKQNSHREKEREREREREREKERERRAIGFNGNAFNFPNTCVDMYIKMSSVPI